GHAGNASNFSGDDRRSTAAETLLMKLGIIFSINIGLLSQNLFLCVLPSCSILSISFVTYFMLG
ncbi:MAG: hypothetical protein LH679_03305, partial [Cyanobacteria bacterium CAN_BIN43]|nr:hypothetical protein [Cyanobacteria bacterium CAN_BIN43]